MTGYNGYTYTYDDNGNILSVSDGTNTTTYVYDSQNQLIRENNQAQGYTHTWTYDNCGNITSRTEYAYTVDTISEDDIPTDTVEYTYNEKIWFDLLRSYDGGPRLTYDGIGNITSDGTWTYWWEHGRQLAYMKQGSTLRWDYTYNADGLRTERTNGTDTYTYIYNGSQLTRLIIDAQDSFDFYFTYDASGTPLTVTENGYTYYYVTNLQGDVIGIKDSSGQQVVTYAYDAWGKLLYRTNTQLADYNPLRYRGYVYDFETGLYYLQSRYYNPEWGRFISADSQLNTNSLLSYNQFSYCENNPIMYSDPCGTCKHKWYFLGLVDCDSCKALKEQEKANTIKYDVPLYKQKETPLCWSFCEEMINSYNSGEKLKQREARQNAITRAENYFQSSNRADWEVGGVPTNAGDLVEIGSIDELYNILNENGPVYAGYANKYGGHMVVVTGVNKYRGEVYTNNPWGVKGVQSFQEFQLGFATKATQGNVMMPLIGIYIPT